MSNRNIDVAFLNKPGFVADTTTSSSTISSSTSSSTSTTSSGSTSSTLFAASEPTESPSSTPPSLYPHPPSVPIAAVFAALYFLLTPYHFYLSIWKPLIAKSVNQKHTYTIPLFIACVLSTIGVATRIPSSATVESRQKIGLYGISQVCIIVSPVCICVTLYLTTTHLIRLCLPVGPEQTFFKISPKWLGTILLVSDVLSFLCQGSGMAVAASGEWQGDRADFGRKLLLVGVVAQLLTFSLSLVVLGMFCLRVKRGHKGEHELARSNSDLGGRDFGFNPLVKEVVKGLWVAGVLLEIRSVFRVAQIGAGPEGYLFQHEWTLLVFDATPVWLALLALGIWHPVKWLQSRRPS